MCRVGLVVMRLICTKYLRFSAKIDCALGVCSLSWVQNVSVCRESTENQEPQTFPVRLETIAKQEEYQKLPEQKKTERQWNTLKKRRHEKKEENKMNDDLRPTWTIYHKKNTANKSITVTYSLKYSFRDLCVCENECEQVSVFGKILLSLITDNIYRLIKWEFLFLYECLSVCVRLSFIQCYLNLLFLATACTQVLKIQAICVG